jgi:mannose-1-phosphate guanylyltransferase/mannose-6-phosphate isomerase
MIEFIPTILSGGSGTRLWPVSRTQFPKQFCDLFEESLFIKTLNRLKPLGSPWVVTNASLKVLTETAMRESNVPLNQALYEPKANNTAPAVAFLCKLLALKNKSSAIVGIFPSDHLIQNQHLFEDAIRLGIACAQKKQVVTIGIKPTFASTGYGYIEIKNDKFLTEKNLVAHPTKGFREKPNEQTAQEFIQAGTFFWNAGMFIFECATMITHLKKFMPELWKIIDGLNEDLSNLNEIYANCPAQSLDYGIMEKLQEQVCIPCDLGWSDVGSWDEIAKLGKSAVLTEVDGENNYVYSKQNRAVGFVGLSDVIVVDTADALLIAKKGSTEKVKSVIESLRAQKDSRATDHSFEYRPWGKFEILRDTSEFKSKVIHVNPGQQLSYQSHKKRAEHWVITRGNPEVVLNDVVHALKPGESIYIPMGAKHRIRNPHASELVEFIEVQVGTYFGEDDITRYQDDYQRT